MFGSCMPRSRPKSQALLCDRAASCRRRRRRAASGQPVSSEAMIAPWLWVCIRKGPGRLLEALGYGRRHRFSFSFPVSKLWDPSCDVYVEADGCPWSVVGACVITDTNPLPKSGCTSTSDVQRHGSSCRCLRLSASALQALTAWAQCPSGIGVLRSGAVWPTLNPRNISCG